MKNISTQQAVVRYYSRPGSRLGYNLVMRGSKHFGYYDANHTTENTAQVRFLEKFSELLDLAPGMNVFDAGCGQGIIATYVAQHNDVHIEGLTLVPFEVTSAQKRTRKAGVSHKTNFQVGDYADPPYPPESFDRIYAVETLSHAPDVALVIQQFMKLLKPGGKLVCIEYESDISQANDADKQDIEFVRKYGAIHGAYQFDKGQFMSTIQKTGFKDVTEYDWTQNVLPSFRRLRRLARPFVPIVNALGLRRFSINAIAAAKYADWTERGMFFFKAYTAVKPSKKRS